jgi:error-prone DNA polymerase
MRMGLRYVRNLGQAEIDRIEAARRSGGAFADIRDFAQRTGLPVDALEGIAASGALSSLGVTRREGLWAAGALAEIGPGRLALAPGVDAPTLPEMGATERHRADLWSTGVSSYHPVEFIRGWLDEQGCVRIGELLARRRNGWRARVGGIVTHRQRPHTARGVIFFNLEDETGLLNVVVLPEVWQVHRKTARREIGLVIDGVVEYRDGVTNLVAREFSTWPAAGVKSRDFR